MKGDPFRWQWFDPEEQGARVPEPTGGTGNRCTEKAVARLYLHVFL